MKKASKVEQAEVRRRLDTFITQPESETQPLASDKLTARQRLFVRAFVGPAFCNAKLAAEMAGYRSENINALEVQGHRLLNDTRVAREIARELNEKCSTAAWAVDVLGSVVGTDMSAFLDVDIQGTVKVNWSKALHAGALGIVQQLELNEDGTVKKFKLYDRVKAAELILRYHGELDNERDPETWPEIIAMYRRSGRARESWPHAVKVKEDQLLLEKHNDPEVKAGASEGVAPR